MGPHLDLVHSQVSRLSVRHALPWPVGSSYDEIADSKELKRVLRDEAKWKAIRTYETARMERGRVNGHYCLGRPYHRPLVTHTCPYRQQIDSTKNECLCCDGCMDKCQNDADKAEVEQERGWGNWTSARRLDHSSASTNSYFYVNIADTTTSNTD